MGKGGRCVRLTTLPPSCALVTKSGNLNFLENFGPVQACNETDLLVFFLILLSAVCVQCPIWLLSVVPWLHVFPRYVAHVFSEWLWNSTSRPYYYWYHLCFYIPALYFYCKVFILTKFLIQPYVNGGRQCCNYTMSCKYIFLYSFLTYTKTAFSERYYRRAGQFWPHSPDLKAAAACHLNKIHYWNSFLILSSQLPLRYLKSQARHV